MANNPYVNKVEKADGTTIMDISDTTATENDVLSGKVFYKASGARSSGSVDLSTKADKVSGATSGNFAGLDSNGNLTDSGSKASDFLTSHQDISGKADKVTGATNGNFAGLDSNGNLTDSGKKASDFATPSDIPSVIDNLTSDSTTDALSAAQGKALNTKPTVTAIQKNSIDLNTLVIPGVYACNHCTNTPNNVDGWFSVEVLPNGGGGDGSASYAIQIATPLGSATTYKRACNNGTWTSWEEFATNANLIINTRATALTSTEQITSVALDNTRCPANQIRWFNMRGASTSDLPSTNCLYGIARVTKRIDNTCFIQIVCDNGLTYTNSYNGASWAGWTTLTLNSKVLTGDNISSLAASTNFNTVVNNGVYRVASNSDATNMTNMPVKEAGRLIVFPTTNNTSSITGETWIYGIQIYITYGGSIYRRTSHTNSATTPTFDAWQKIVTKNDIAWSDITGKPNTAGASGGTDLTLVTTGDRYNWDNNYIQKISQGSLGSLSAGGSNNYFKLLTITVTSAWANYPITIELSQRARALHWLNVIFQPVDHKDPDLLSFTTNNVNQNYWIKKSATSTWEIYGQYTDVWGYVSLSRITGAAVGNTASVTVNLTNAGTTAPGGTQVTYGWNVNYASTAGSANSVAWTGVTGSPIVVETTNLTFSSGYVDVADKSGYYLANAYSCSRDEKNYGILFFVQRTNGNYRLYNNDASLSASLSVRRIWIKASS